MAIIMFLFGSALGLIGALLQFALGTGGFFEALQTYALIAFGLPMTTLMAIYMRRTSDKDEHFNA
jgi:hypothetical protein